MCDITIFCLIAVFVICPIFLLIYGIGQNLIERNLYMKIFTDKKEGKNNLHKAMHIAFGDNFDFGELEQMKHKIYDIEILRQDSNDRVFRLYKSVNGNDPTEEWLQNNEYYCYYTKLNDVKRYYADINKNNWVDMGIGGKEGNIKTYIIYSERKSVIEPSEEEIKIDELRDKNEI